MKCRIFIDTNPIWEDKSPFSTLFNSSLSDLVDFLKRHSVKNVSVCLPEIVIMERIQHKLESINSAREYINERIKSLREAGHTEEEIKPRDNYKEKLDEYAKNFCSSNNIEIIKTPNISIGEITEMAINKKKPFNDHGSGFKDTLIYLSMVDDAKNNESNLYLMCTNNSKQFDQEIINDFKEKVNKELVILPDIISVQQKLDEIVPIGLKLEERNTEVKKLVLNKLGDLMKEVNKIKNTKNKVLNAWNYLTPDYVDTSFSFYDRYKNEDEEDFKIAGYNFNDLIFSSIDEVSENNFSVQGEIKCNIVYQNNEKNDRKAISLHNPYIFDSSINFMDIYSGYGISESYNPKQRNFTFSLECNLKTKNIYVKNIRKSTF